MIKAIPVINCTEPEFYETMRQSELGDNWYHWHAANPDFFALFEKFTAEAISMGHKALSGWLIVNRVRWETNVVTKGGEFKISNNYISLFARLYMIRNPQYVGFFKTNRMKSLVNDVFNPII